MIAETDSQKKDRLQREILKEQREAAADARKRKIVVERLFNEDKSLLGCMQEYMTSLSVEDEDMINKYSEELEDVMRIC